MNTTPPDVSAIELGKLPERSFPASQEYRVVLSERAHDVILAHARETPDVEVCGVLVGEVYRDPSGAFLEVADAIRGERAAGHSSQVIFTHDTWAHINRVKDASFPESKIVGWYHTHPGFGVFLSPQDSFIHKGFFDLPWQVAIVVDPVSHDEGVFVWSKGEPFRVEGFWIGTQRTGARRPGMDPAAASESASGQETRSQPRRRAPLAVATALACAVSVVSVCAFLQANLRLRATRVALQRIEDSRRSAPTQRAPVDLESLRTALGQAEMLTGLDIGLLEDGGHVSCRGNVYTWGQKELVGAIVASTPGVKSVDMQLLKVTHRYVPVPGEYLSGIASRAYGNASCWPLILAANSKTIKDPDLILAGVPLRLPEVISPADEKER